MRATSRASARAASAEARAASASVWSAPGATARRVSKNAAAQATSIEAVYAVARLRKLCAFLDRSARQRLTSAGARARRAIAYDRSLLSVAGGWSGVGGAGVGPRSAGGAGGGGGGVAMEG